MPAGYTCRVTMTRTLDLRDEIEAMPLGRQHRVIVAILAVATLFDGYNVFVPAYVIPYGIRTWHLLPSEAGLLVSSGLVGFMIGSIANGTIADRIGRKPVLAASLLCAAIGNLITAASVDTYGEFLAARLATGLALGMILPLCVTLLNEVAPRRVANVLLGWVMAGWSIGGAAAALASIALLPSHGWRALFAVGGLAVPLAALVGVLLPESPRFLALRRRHDEVCAVLGRLAPSRREHYAQCEFTSHEDTHHRGSFLRLLGPDLRAGTLTVWACAALSLFTIFGLSSWTPQVMLERGAPLATSFGFGALLQLTAVLGGLGCGWIADRMGRDRTLIMSWLCGAGAIGGLAILSAPAIDVALVSIAGFCVMGAQPVLNNRTASLYGTAVRSTGVGAQLGVGRLGGILGPYVGGWLQQLLPGPAALLLCMAGAVASCALCLRLLDGGRLPTRAAAPE
jgi:MFS transporter, AAHS family, 4-hydroxybenzoate transporter